jgi:protein SCO1/2
MQTNRKMERSPPVGVLLLVVAVAVMFGLPFIEVLNRDNSSYGYLVDRPAPDFRLLRHDGNTFELDQLGGQFSFLMFGYLNCDEVCHLQAGVLKELSQLVDSNEKLKFVYISMDPERDSAQLLKHYFDDYADNFVSLRQTDGQRLQELANAYRHQFAKRGGTDKNSYSIEHSGYFYLIDPDKKIKRIYSPGHTNVQRIMADLQTLRKTNT